MVNTFLRFLDCSKQEVAVGLAIYKKYKFHPCTPQQANDVLLDGAPLLDNVEN
jgi:hypothetical protein